MNTEHPQWGVRHGLIGSAIIIAAMMGVSVFAMAHLKPGSHVPVHWNAAGKVDGYGSPAAALWLMPFIAVGTAALMAGITFFEPRREHIRQSMHAYVMIWYCVLTVLLITHGATLSAALGQKINMTRIMTITVGVMFVVLGNFMGKLRSNFFAGVRTPWTLSSELSWNKTHRLTGRLFVALGIVSVIVGIADSATGVMALYLGAVPAMLVAILVYSYLVWKTDPDRQTVGA